jgi:nucleosome binding factor SPN SPT16 subunit
MSSRWRDEDGLAEEQEERRRKKKWNERFLQFVKEVEDKLTKDTSAGNRIEFDIPYKELGFTGVPAKQQVTIMPTVHSLIALDDNPPMVVTLADVEVAVFERIQFGLKNFDLVFVWKVRFHSYSLLQSPSLYSFDLLVPHAFNHLVWFSMFVCLLIPLFCFCMQDFKKLPMRIEAIPIKSFEPIKHWLNSCDIVFYESSQNILWKTVMKQINDDVEGFWQDGGFDIFLSRNAEDGGATSDEDEEEEEEEEEEDENAAAAGGGEGGEGGAGESGKSKSKAKAKKKKKDEESESDFEPDSESGSDSEEYETPSEEDYSGDDSDEDDSDASGGDSEEEGMDWDELDKKAAREDKEKAQRIREKQGSDADLSSGDDDEERHRKKKKHKQVPPPAGKNNSSSAIPPKRK